MLPASCTHSATTAHGLLPISVHAETRHFETVSKQGPLSWSLSVGLVTRMSALACDRLGLLSDGMQRIRTRHAFVQCGHS